eukprot:gene509-1918_t
MLPQYMAMLTCIGTSDRNRGTATQGGLTPKVGKKNPAGSTSQQGGSLAFVLGNGSQMQPSALRIALPTALPTVHSPALHSQVGETNPVGSASQQGGSLAFVLGNGSQMQPTAQAPAVGEKPPGSASQQGGSLASFVLGNGSRPTVGTKGPSGSNSPAAVSSPGGTPRATPKKAALSLVSPAGSPRYGHSSFQGMRDYQEDAVATHKTGISFAAGVFDGHGGDQVSKELERVLLQNIQQQLSQFSSTDRMNIQQQLSQFSSTDRTEPGPQNIQQQLAQFSSTDLTAHGPPVNDIHNAISTAYTSTNSDIGTRMESAMEAAVRIFGPPGAKRAIRLSQDHKPQAHVSPSEVARVCNAGGCVLWGRVQMRAVEGPFPTRYDVLRNVRPVPRRDPTLGRARLVPAPPSPLAPPTCPPLLPRVPSEPPLGRPSTRGAPIARPSAPPRSPPLLMVPSPAFPPPLPPAAHDKTLAPYVIADPHTISRPLNPVVDDFIYLVSDGVTDLIEDGADGVIYFKEDGAGCAIVNEQLSRGNSTAQAAAALTQAAYQQGSSDNISAIVIRISHRCGGGLIKTLSSGSDKK